MTYLGFGHGLVWVALALAVATVAFGLLGRALSDRRFVAAARNAMIAGGFASAGAAACLVAGFLRGAYDVHYIYNYSERKLPVIKKIAGLWAGLDGSILFWTAILGLVGSVLAAGFLKRDVDPARRRLEPWLYAVFGSVQTFFLVVIAWVASPFDGHDPHVIERLTERGLAFGGMPTDGAGLNPLLDTYWMMIHPPSVYLGFILYTVPFAYGCAALLAGEFSPTWIKATRGWTMAAWLLNTNGIILGGLWAYEVLGWGGYWAWDPVENASFLPWLSGTAFLHSVMVQERRDMMRGWNALLVCTTFILSIFGTYLTRSGIVSSVHAFASGEVGDWFLGFLIALIGFSAFLLVLRFRDFRTPRSIDRLLSREAAFVLNNFVLLSIAAAIVLLTLWPKISVEIVGEAISVGVPVYNKVCTPLFVALLFLTAVGPTMGWVATSADRAMKNLLGPAIVSLLLAAGVQWFAWAVVRGGRQGEEFPLVDHVYPTYVILFLACLTITSLGWEVVRTALQSSRASGRDLAGTFLRLVTFQNRRYGGYLVHVGLSVLAISIVTSSMYRTTTELSLRKGTRLPIAEGGSMEIELRGISPSRAHPGQPYHAGRADVALYRDGVEIASMAPEFRLYPKTGHRREPTNTTEVEIARLPNQDVYVYFERPERVTDSEFDDRAGFEARTFRFTVFRNPFMWLFWTGWITMLVGGAYAALPLGGKKVGLAG